MADLPNLDLIITGSGAMGCLLAARLASAGVQVAVLDGWTEGIAAIQAKGIRLVEEDGSEKIARVRTAVDGKELPKASTALVMVKSWQTRAAAERLAPCLVPGSVVLTLQNGLGNDAILADCLPQVHVTAGVTTAAATLLAPGVTQARGKGEIALGEDVQLDRLAVWFRKASFTVHSEKSLVSLQWGKLVVNAAINPLTALLDVPNGRLLEDAHLRTVLSALVEEAVRVAEELHIDLPYPDPQAYISQVIRQTAGNISSMLQDRRRGAPMELEAITGELLRYGAMAGVDMPTHQAVYHLLLALTSAPGNGVLEVSK
jgi:2-dehydropantoate 2-reductase